MLGLNNKVTSPIPPTNPASMRGAGLTLDGKEFVTHTTLDVKNTALFNTTPTQRLFILTLILILIFQLVNSPLITVIALLGALSAIYFFDTAFYLYLIVKSLGADPDIKFDEEDLLSLSDEELPVYTILCPLYKEERVVGRFLESIENINWPKEKLDVILLLEEDDAPTIDAVSKLNLPPYMRAVVVPSSYPKTKPKACNYGLSLAKGEYLVVYDAEDKPEEFQLKKAYLGFQKVAEDVVCLQAKLNYYNSTQNTLTKLFTAEYSLWFDVVLPGLQMMETAIPLGGTSNHFKTASLLKLEGWDAFNVTEDADLGVRLFKSGYKTAIIDSTTYEEANSQLGNWIRQRSRWIKGYIQTYFVNMRNPMAFFSKYGSHAWIFQLLIGGKIAFCFINPVLWLMTISYFALYGIVGPTIESIYPPHIFYTALVSLIFGNFMFFYVYMISVAKKSQWLIMKSLFFVPVYWLMISFASFIALYQFIVKPHYWEKTNHGLDSQFLKSHKVAWRPA